MCTCRGWSTIGVQAGRRSGTVAPGVRARPPVCFTSVSSVHAASPRQKNFRVSGYVARRVSSDCVAQPERAVRALVCDVLFGLGSENVAHIAADGSSPVVISSSATVDDIWRDV